MFFKKKSYVYDAFKDYISDEDMEKAVSDVKHGEVSGNLVFLIILVGSSTLERTKEMIIQVTNIAYKNNGMVMCNMSPLVLITFSYPNLNSPESFDDCTKTVLSIGNELKNKGTYKIVYGKGFGECGLIGTDIPIFSLVLEHYDIYLEKLMGLEPCEICHIDSLK